MRSPGPSRTGGLDRCERLDGGAATHEPTAALAAGNPIADEQAAFEIPFIPLPDARALVELYAQKEDRKFERAALEYLAEANPSLTDVAQVAALLPSAACSCAG